MIAYLKGKLIEKNPQEAVIDVGGVGYRVFITLNGYEALPEKGREVELPTVTISREDAMHLYGFADRDEKEMFLKLIGVTRIGPKLACAILSGVKADVIRTAIVNRDKASFSRMPGVGPKTAERIIMELKDKFGPDAGIETSVDGGRDAVDAVAALVNLGYRKPQAEKAVSKICSQRPDVGLEVGEIIRKALKALSL